MPEHALDILEGVAWGVSFVQIAQEPGIPERTVRVRLERMRTLYRARMKELGLWPGRETLGVLVPPLGSVATLLLAA